MLNDEILDIVNDEDQVVGTMQRSEFYTRSLTCFRVVNGFLVNAGGELWIPRRAPHKKLFPSRLDVSVGGHVKSGETYEDAFRRELHEELGLDISEVRIHLLGYLTPAEDAVSAFMKVWEIRTHKIPHPNPSDFTEYFWLSPAAAMRRIQSGDMGKGDLSRLLDIFYGPFIS